MLVNHNIKNVSSVYCSVYLLCGNIINDLTIKQNSKKNQQLTSVHILLSWANWVAKTVKLGVDKLLQIMSLHAFYKQTVLSRSVLTELWVGTNAVVNLLLLQSYMLCFTLT